MNSKVQTGIKTLENSAVFFKLFEPVPTNEEIATCIGADLVGGDTDGYSSAIFYFPNFHSQVVGVRLSDDRVVIFTIFDNFVSRMCKLGMLTRK